METKWMERHFFEACLLPTHKGGQLSISDNQITARNCSEVTLMLYAATSYNGPRKSPSKEGKIRIRRS